MTQPSAAPVVRPEVGSRLDALAAQYAVLKPKLDELTELLKTVTDAIKTEMAGTGAETTLLASPHLSNLLRLQLVASWRLDSTRLKKEHPELWVTYAKKSHSWRLDQVPG